MPIKIGVGARQERIDLNMIRLTEDGTPHPVGQQYYDKVTGEIIKKGEAARGYNVGGDQFVILTDDNLKALEPKSSRLIQLQEFVASSEIDPLYFENSYYVEPEPAGYKVYALLVAAMKAGNRQTGKNMVAIARWTHSSREHTVAFRVFEDGLMMHTLFYPDEVKEAPTVEDVDVNEAEVNMATILLKSMTGKFDPAKYADTYRTNLQALIDFRIAAKEIKGVASVATPEGATIPAAVPDLMAALKASLELSKKPKVKKVGSSE